MVCKSAVKLLTEKITAMVGLGYTFYGQILTKIDKEEQIVAGASSLKRKDLHHAQQKMNNGHVKT